MILSTVGETFFSSERELAVSPAVPEHDRIAGGEAMVNLDVDQKILIERVIARGNVGARSECDQLNEIPSVKGWFGNRFGGDDLAERRRFGLEQECLGGDFHRFTDFADFQPKVDANAVLHPQSHVVAD